MSGALQAMYLSSGAASYGLNPLWSNVVLALHFDGTNGSTAFTDQKAHTVTRIGTPTITTTQSKFGGASGNFSNGGITVGGNAYNADYDFGTGDFAIRCWVRPSSTADMVIFDTRLDGATEAGVVVWLSAGALSVYTGTTYIAQDTVALPVNTWTHVEVVRVGNSLWTFKNGVALTAPASVAAYSFTDGRCYVGQHNTFGGGGFNFVGQIDDLQVVKGQGLHTANFTPPAAAWPNF